MMALLRRYHFTIVVLIATAFLAYEGLFLYRYFYVALTESRDLSAFKEQGALEEVKSNIYQALLSFNEKKHSLPAPDSTMLRDLFVTPKSLPLPLTTTPSPTASSSPRR